jgi:hypothetical protein
MFSKFQSAQASQVPPLNLQSSAPSVSYFKALELKLLDCTRNSVCLAFDHAFFARNSLEILSCITNVSVFLKSRTEEWLLKLTSFQLYS